VRGRPGLYISHREGFLFPASCSGFDVCGDVLAKGFSYVEEEFGGQKDRPTREGPLLAGLYRVTLKSSNDAHCEGKALRGQLPKALRDQYDAGGRFCFVYERISSISAPYELVPLQDAHNSQLDAMKIEDPHTAIYDRQSSAILGLAVGYIYRGYGIVSDKHKCPVEINEIALLTKIFPDADQQDAARTH
jgi:hypothetical protein